jgi:hypothetical protein
MENTLCLLYKDRSVKFLGTIALRSEDHTKYINTLSVGEYRVLIITGGGTVRIATIAF